MLMLSIHSNAPDAVLRTGFDEDFGAFAQKKLTQFIVLNELGDCSCDYNFETIAGPGFLIEIFNLPA